MKKLLLGIFLFVVSLASFSQTTMGTEFWLNFFHNNGGDDMFVIVAAPTGANVTINMPANSFTTSLSLAPNGLTRVFIPRNYEPSNTDTFLKNAIHVIADKEIIVYALSAASASTDATCVIPASAQPNNGYYIINSYNYTMPGFGGSNVFSVVPHDSNVVVEITPTSATSSGRLAGRSYTKTLHKGDLYIVRNATNGGLVGSTIKVFSPEKKISVYQGNDCVFIDCGACDHLFEVVPPTSVYGKKFILTPFYGATNGYLYTVMGTKDSTVVYRNGNPVDTINFGEQYVEKVNQDISICVSTSTPSIITQIMIGCNQFAVGDPAIVYAVPVEQTITSSIISTANTSLIKNHFINVLLPKSGIEQFYIDSVKVSSSKFKQVYCGDFYFYSDTISSGNHTVQCDDGFIAYVYGMGQAESYAYFAAASLRNLELGFDFEIIPNCDSGILVRFTPRTRQDTLERYRWVFPANCIIDSDSVKSPTVYFPDAGNFNVKLYGYSKELGWLETEQIAIIARVPKLASVITNLTLDKQCLIENRFNFEAITLYGKSPYKYQWIVEGKNTSSNVKYSHNYLAPIVDAVQLITIDDNECRDTTYYDVEVFKLATVDFEAGTVCPNTEITFNALVSPSGVQGLSYDWDLGDGAKSTVNPVKHTYQGKDTKYNISVRISTPNGCADTSETKTVVIYDEPIARFAFTVLEPQTGAIPYAFRDSSDGAVTVKWFIEGANYSETKFIHNFKQVGPQTITLFSYNAQGCEDSTSVNLLVESPSRIYMANSFSPNGDGRNEFFGPENLAPVKEYYFALFNRWGEKLFETSDPTQKWDGKYKGVEVMQGNYLYMVNLVFQNEERYKTDGQVLLLR